MKKTIYILGILIALGILIYFYGFNFDNMSETELVNSVLYWYVPLVFGLYGLAGLRIAKSAGDANINAIKHVFSGKDVPLLVLVVIIAFLGGIVGIVVFILPLAFFKTGSRNFDISVALTGTLVWLILLWAFFKVLWPAL